MRLKRRVGCFGLYGYDFMIDENMKVWLIEINVNPALTTNTQTLIEAIPPVVKESIRMSFISSQKKTILFVFFSKVLSIECFEKIRHNQKMFPLKNLKGFKCIFNELERKGSMAYAEQKRATSSFQRKNPSPPTTTTLKTTSSNVKEIKPIISYSLRQNDENHVREHLLTPLKRKKTNLSEPLVVKYENVNKLRNHFQVLKPTTITAEQLQFFDEKTNNNRLSKMANTKSLVFISKSSSANKSIQT